jgi:hypothetical protein
MPGLMWSARRVRCGVAVIREPEQMIAFLQGQAQTTDEGGEHPL